MAKLIYKKKGTKIVITYEIFTDINIPVYELKAR